MGNIITCDQVIIISFSRNQGDWLELVEYPRLGAAKRGVGGHQKVTASSLQLDMIQPLFVFMRKQFIF
jgi:hypothetical protein